MISLFMPLQRFVWGLQLAFNDPSSLYAVMMFFSIFSPVFFIQLSVFLYCYILYELFSKVLYILVFWSSLSVSPFCICCIHHICSYFHSSKNHSLLSGFVCSAASTACFFTFLSNYFPSLLFVINDYVHFPLSFSIKFFCVPIYFMFSVWYFSAILSFDNKLIRVTVYSSTLLKHLVKRNVSCWNVVEGM